MARGGFIGLVIEMKKGTDDACVLANEAIALAKLGKHRDALAKFRPALADQQTSGDDAGAVHIHFMMIKCHAALQEVS